MTAQTDAGSAWPLSHDLGTHYQATLDTGGHEAALFEDSIADGFSTTTVEGLPRSLMCRPVFSIVGAPEFILCLPHPTGCFRPGPRPGPFCRHDRDKSVISGARESGE